MHQSYKEIHLLVVEKIFKIFSIYGLCGHLGYVSWTKYIFFPLLPEDKIISLTSWLTMYNPKAEMRGCTLGTQMIKKTQGSCTVIIPFL